MPLKTTKALRDALMKHAAEVMVRGHNCWAALQIEKTDGTSVFTPRQKGVIFCRGEKLVCYAPPGGMHFPVPSTGKAWICLYIDENSVNDNWAMRFSVKELVSPSETVVLEQTKAEVTEN